MRNFNRNFASGLVLAAKAAGVPKFKAQRHDRTDPKLLALFRTHKKLSAALTNAALTATDRATIVQGLEKTTTDIRSKLDELAGEEEGKVVERLRSNPSLFYRYANKNLKSRSPVGPLKEGKHYQDGPKRMAEMLSTQYQGAFSKPLDDYSHLSFTQASCPQLDDVTFTQDSIIIAGEKLNIQAAPGPDGIPAYLLRHFIKVLAAPLHYMWRVSLDSGLMPEGTVRSIVTPIFKPGGSRSLAKDYRPVSLTNHVTKIFERVIHTALTDHVESFHLINETQHGFRPGRSTITQLLRFYDSILTLLDEGHSVDAIYLDFAKAFDKVDHTILLKKLSSLQISGKVHAWLAEFLCNREQQVRVEGELSKPTKVVSGVPQGSVLGPLLFLVLIMDLDRDTCHALVGIYADDTRLWRVSSTDSDWAFLQEELERTYQWATRNNMTFNFTKFESLRFQKWPRNVDLEPLYRESSDVGSVY